MQRRRGGKVGADTRNSVFAMGQGKGLARPPAANFHPLAAGSCPSPGASFEIQVRTRSRSFRLNFPFSLSLPAPRRQSRATSPPLRQLRTVSLAAPSKNGPARVPGIKFPEARNEQRRGRYRSASRVASCPTTTPTSPGSTNARMRCVSSSGSGNLPPPPLNRALCWVVEAS